MRIVKANKLSEIFRNIVIYFLALLIISVNEYNLFSAENSGGESLFQSCSQSNPDIISAISERNNIEAAFGYCYLPIILENESSDENEDYFSYAEGYSSGSFELALISEYISQIGAGSFLFFPKIPLYIINCSWKHFLI